MKRRRSVYRWVSVNGGPQPGPPSVSIDGQDPTAVLVFTSWAEFAELVNTCKGILSAEMSRRKERRAARAKGATR